MNNDKYKPVDVLVGLQYGDEGKGKVINAIAEQYDVIARFQGGANSGHTVYDKDGNKAVFNVVPSGMIAAGVIGVITQGVVINPLDFVSELNRLMSNKYMKDMLTRLVISKDVNITLPTHILADYCSEEARKRRGEAIIGSTKRGNTPTYEDRVARRGITIRDILNNGWEGRYLDMRNSHMQVLSSRYNIPIGEMFSIELTGGKTISEYEAEWYAAAQEMRNGIIYTDNSAVYLNDCIKEGKRILLEAAQGAMLDVEYGTYPYVTSTRVTAPSAFAQCGIPAQLCGKVFGVMKPYITRVGQGFFPTHIKEDNKIDWPDAEHIVEIGHEYGSVTKRKRMIGWLDLPQLRYACDINGVTDIVLAKVDVVSGIDSINFCTSYVGENTKEIHVYNGTADVVCNMQRIKSVGDVSSYDGGEDMPIDLKNLIDIINTAVSDTVTKPRVTFISTSPTKDLIAV